MSHNEPVRHIPYDLGVVTDGKKVHLFINLIGFDHSPFRLCSSDNGISFKPSRKVPMITDENGNIQNTLHTRDFRISEINKRFVATYKTKEDSGYKLTIASSKDLQNWSVLGTEDSIHEVGMVVPNFTVDKKHVMYYGENEINIAFSDDLKTWKSAGTVLTPHSKYFDKHPLEIGGILVQKDGILVFYYTKEHFREGTYYSVGAAMFDLKDPKKLIWRRTNPVCVQKAEDHGGELYPLGVVYFKEKLLMYFGVRGKYVFAVHYAKFDDLFEELPSRAKPRLEKHDKNPILTPVLHHSWESTGAFNPGAVYDDEKVHILYRAMGPGNTSVIGYATSPDGLDVDYRHHEPIYVPREPFETPGGSPKIWMMSGGGYGGCEDPRITKIEEDEAFYLTYIAYDGANPPRVALSSISTPDFRSRNFKAWSKAKLISPPNVVDKNAVIFPEKINGKYVIMHRIFPNILIDFLDDLEFKNSYLKGEYRIEPKENAWDSRKVGAGPPPIKTKDGWLLIYHAVDDRNDSQYKMGAMLLDLKDPTKVIYRTNHPILEPTEWYENHGFKAGVAYPCGAVVIKNRLFVYYGGADSVTCAATKDVDELLSELKSYHPVNKRTPVHSRTVLNHYA